MLLEDQDAHFLFSFSFLLKLHKGVQEWLYIIIEQQKNDIIKKYMSSDHTHISDLINFFS